MKRLIIGILTFVTLSLTAGAQTVQEIISKMETAFESNESKGLIMTIETKIPILGTMSVKSYSLGNKMRMETEVMGIEMISWSDGETMWSYTPEENEIEIENDSESASEEGGDAEMFSDITDGYDVSIKKETAQAWHIRCVKSKNNPDKDAPKNMDLVVAKDTFLPISLSTKMSGITMTMRDIQFGFDENLVNFDIKDYPNAKIIDKRNEKK